jgi:hypothetical protein
MLASAQYAEDDAWLVVPARLACLVDNVFSIFKRNLGGRFFRSASGSRF